MLSRHQTLTKTAQGHVERVGKDMYLAVIQDNRRNHFELMELDPYSAQQSAECFCALNGISLNEFTVPAEVKQAHLADIGDFVEEHMGRRVKPEYIPSIRKAI